MFGYGAACLVLNTGRTVPGEAGENVTKRVRSIRARYMKAVSAKKVEHYGYNGMAAAKTHSARERRVR
ncbi:MAG: hypothetical protein NUW23_02545 [Firmicutes bacterium]|jgi:hypothetical protein|nr:hypothetical protein [Bacillota bacterium]